MKTKSGNITYWILTSLVALPFLGSGIGYLIEAPPIAAGMHRLGYPPYLIRFLGVAKLLAVLAIVADKFPKVKEWAYAGLVFNTVGALYSHLRSDELREAIVPAVILGVIAASYLSWRKRDLSEARGPI